MRLIAILPLVLFFVEVVLSRDIPQNLKAFYDQYKTGNCPKVLKIGFQTGGRKDPGYKYCSTQAGNLIWVAGKSSLADMDTDCDGANNAAGGCSNDPTGQGQTAFKDEIQKFGITDLDPNKHSYIVFGNNGYNPNFEPAQYGVPTLGVGVVVCRDKFFYAVWGDTNSGTLIGEASISLATACFGSGMTGNSGHSDSDVLYLLFTGRNAKADASVNWKAKTFDEFEASLGNIGSPLLQAVCNDSYGTGCTGDGSASGSAPSSSGRGSGSKSIGARVIRGDAWFGFGVGLIGGLLGFCVFFWIF